jgi:hypothetical protein
MIQGVVSPTPPPPPPPSFEPPPPPPVVTAPRPRRSPQYPGRNAQRGRGCYGANALRLVGIQHPHRPMTPLPTNHAEHRWRSHWPAFAGFHCPADNRTKRRYLSAEGFVNDRKDDLVQPASICLQKPCPPPQNPDPRGASELGDRWNIDLIVPKCGIRFRYVRAVAANPVSFGGTSK